MISKSLPLFLVVAAVGMVGLFGLVNPVGAQQADIERSLSHSEVAPGGTVTVTISNLGLGAAGGIGNVEETIPDDFTYVPGSAASATGGTGAVINPPTISGQTLDFFMLGVDSFTYEVSVDSDAADGSGTFSGRFIGFGGTARSIDDDSITIADDSTTTPDPDPSPEPGNGGTSPSGSVERSLPSVSVEAGGQFDVTISGLGLGSAGGIGTVEEMLPSGFSFVVGSASVDSGGTGAVISGTASGGTVTFSMVGVDSFTYDVTVGSGVGYGTYDFSGDFINFANVRTAIGGDASVSVMAAEPPETGLRRSFPSAQIEAGDDVRVTISGLGLGASGGVGTVEESLPTEVTFSGGSEAVDSGGNGAVINSSASGQTITFTMVGVDSFTYDVTVGSGVGYGTYGFSGDFINFANVRTSIGGDGSLMVGPEPTPVPTTPVPTTPEPTPGPGETPTATTRTPRATAVPPAPATPVAIEKVDVTAVEGATTVQPDASSMVSSADGKATVMLPNTSRARTYQVMVSSDAANCSGASGSLQACAGISSYDAEGNMETGVELIRRATVVLMLDSAAVEDLDGLPVVFQANALGAFSAQQMNANGAWSSRRFSMALTEDGGVAITVTGLRSLGSVALSVDEDILQTAMYQVAGITPTAVPAPVATVAPTATPLPVVVTPDPTDEEPIVGDATAPVGLLIVLALTGALMVYTGSRVMRGRRSAPR